MARVKMPSVSEAAAQILREVEAEQRIKTAEVQLLHGVKNAQLTSEEARDLIKLQTPVARSTSRIPRSPMTTSTTS